MTDGLSPQLLWFLLGIGLALAELALPGFVIFFFGIGAWVTAVTTWLGFTGSLESQLMVFLGSSLVSLYLFRRKGVQAFKGKVSGVSVDVDDIRGARAVVTVEIDPKGVEGKVEFHGTSWAAESDVRIAAGTVVEVVERTNLTLKVKPV